MDVFIKSFSTYRTVKKAAIILGSLVIDSLDSDTSSVTVKGTNIGRADAGSWAIIDGAVYLLSGVKPEPDRTILTLLPPLDAFARQLLPVDQFLADSIGAFIANELARNWIQCDDPLYAVPYLTVSNSDTTAFVSPNLDSTGSFSLPDYVRLARRSYRVNVRFFDGGSHLKCEIFRAAERKRQIVFNDGRSQLESVDYSSSGAAKVTVRTETANGIDLSEWYLAEDGSVCNYVPSRRAAGSWLVITAKDGDDIKAKVVETFAKNQTSHKLEFWSSIDINVQDNCTFMVYGELLHSHIAYKRSTNEDGRFFYKSGELATTATEKMRGVLK